MPEIEDEYTDFDYRKLLPDRDYRDGVMPPLRLRQLQLTHKKRAEFHDATCIYVPNHKLMQNAGIARADFVPQPSMSQRLISRYSVNTPLKRFRTRQRSVKTPKLSLDSDSSAVSSAANASDYIDE